MFRDSGPGNVGKYNVGKNFLSFSAFRDFSDPSEPDFQEEMIARPGIRACQTLLVQKGRG